MIFNGTYQGGSKIQQKMLMHYACMSIFYLMTPPWYTPLKNQKIIVTKNIYLKNLKPNLKKNIYTCRGVRSWTGFVAIFVKKIFRQIFVKKNRLYVVFTAWYYVPFQSRSSIKDIIKFCPIWEYMPKNVSNNCLTKRKEYKQKPDYSMFLWHLIYHRNVFFYLKTVL